VDGIHGPQFGWRHGAGLTEDGIVDADEVDSAKDGPPGREGLLPPCQASRETSAISGPSAGPGRLTAYKPERRSGVRPLENEEIKVDNT